MLHRTEGSRNKQERENAISFFFSSPFFAFTPEKSNFHRFTIKIVERDKINFRWKTNPLAFHSKSTTSFIHLSSLFLPLKYSSCSEGLFCWKRSAKEEKGSRAGFQPGGGSCAAEGSRLPHLLSQPAAAICYTNKSSLKSPSGVPLSTAKLSISSGNSLVK